MAVEAAGPGGDPGPDPVPWRSPRAGRSARMRGESLAASSPEMRAAGDRIVALAASIHAAEAELVGMLTEFDAGDGWCGHGYRSLEHWLSVQAGFTLAEGKVRARLADRSPELPCLMAAAAEGRLSVGAARAASRVGTPDNDHRVTEVATLATAQQAARTFAAYERAEEYERSRQPSPPPEADTPEAVEATVEADGERRTVWLSSHWDDQGFLCLSGRLGPSDGALFRPALEAMRSLGGLVGGPADVPDAAAARVTNVEAFRRFCEMALDVANRRGLRDRGGDRFAVHVTIDLDVLAGTRLGRGVIDDGTSIDPCLIRSWMGEATIDGLVMRDNQPLWSGREKRLANRSIRRALRARDGGGCAYPGCDQHYWVDAHHVIFWELGGLTDVDNMVLLCRRHHTSLHLGKYSIVMVGGRPVFHLNDDRRARAGPGAPPAGLRSVADPSRARRSGEPLTHYGLDVLATSLLLAAA